MELKALMSDPFLHGAGIAASSAGKRPKTAPEFPSIVKKLPGFTFTRARRHGATFRDRPEAAHGGPKTHPTGPNIGTTREPRTETVNFHSEAGQRPPRRPPRCPL
eukprot:3150520-Pyramimonas_sp.AAC.1